VKADIIGILTRRHLLEGEDSQFDLTTLRFSCGTRHGYGLHSSGSAAH